MPFYKICVYCRAIKQIFYKMTEKTKRIATVGFDSVYQDDLHQLCKSLGMTKGQFIEASINFFKRTGINPNSHLEDTRSQIKELRTTFISFQRNHEKILKDDFSKVHNEQELIMKTLVELYSNLVSVVEKSTETNKELTTISIQLSQLQK